MNTYREDNESLSNKKLGQRIQVLISWQLHLGLSKSVFVKREESAKLIEQNVTTTTFSNCLKSRRIREIPLIHPKIEFKSVFENCALYCDFNFRVWRRRIWIAWSDHSKRLNALLNQALSFWVLTLWGTLKNKLTQNCRPNIKELSIQMIQSWKSISSHEATRRSWLGQYQGNIPCVPRHFEGHQNIKHNSSSEE